MENASGFFYCVIGAFLLMNGCPAQENKWEPPAFCGQYSGPVCTKEFVPVCADIGVAYSNKCYLCHAINARHLDVGSFRYGKCERPQPPAFCRELADTWPECSGESQLVCADNGVTYGNKCFMCADIDANKLSVRSFHYGRCDSQ